jgi:hypothetical protein
MFDRCHLFRVLYETEGAAMRIATRTTLAGFVFALVLTGGSARAGSVIVHDDSGGGSLMTVLGTSNGGTITANSSNVLTFEVNGVTGLSLPTSYNVSITDGALIGGVLSITASGSTTIGTVPGSETILDFTAAGSALNVGNTGYIILSGVINSVPLDNYPGYSFSPSMIDATISLTITKTLTDYTQVLGHNTVVVHDSGFGFQQDDAVVPEPASMILLGIGMSSLVAFRRFRRRRSVA